MKSKSNVRKTGKKSKPKSFSSRVKKVINQQLETKNACAEIVQNPTANQTFWFHSPTQNIAPGTSNFGRIGDSIRLHKMKINGYFNAPPTALTNTKWRFTVFYSSKPAAAAGQTSGAFNASELFYPNTSTINIIGGLFDDKAVTVLADQTFDVNSNVSTAQDVKSFAMEINLRDQLMEYNESGSAFGKKRNLYVLVYGFTPNGAAVGNIGVFYYSYTLQYKDN